MESQLLCVSDPVFPWVSLGLVALHPQLLNAEFRRCDCFASNIFPQIQITVAVALPLMDLTVSDPNFLPTEILVLVIDHSLA